MAWEGGLIALSSVIGLALIFVAPRPHPMWASCTLYVHVFYCYTVLTLEAVPQALLVFSLSIAGAFVVLNEHIAPETPGGSLSPGQFTSILSLALWLSLFNVAGFVFAMRRRKKLMHHLQHRQASMQCADAIAEDVAACKQLLQNMFPPQILVRLMLEHETLNMRSAELRGIITAQSYNGCSFLFAKVVGLHQLVADAQQPPMKVVQLLQSIFNKFDTLADTYNVQKVRKTVNDYYMVAAGLPDPELLSSPEQRAHGICGLATAMLHIMDVVNAEQTTVFTPLEVQIGIHSGSAIAGVIGHRRIQYDLLGDAVNTAARMCSHSLPGRVLISSDTYQLVSPHFDTTANEPRAVKGKGQMQTYFLDRRNAVTA